MSKEFGPIGRVVIELIDHADQRYETAGDWYRERNGKGETNHLVTAEDGQCILVIRASRLKGDPENFFALAVAYHELGEALGCLANGITEKEVDKFDNEYKGKGEPGDDIHSPYKVYHGLATACERILIDALGLLWGNYEKAINGLPKWRGKK